MNCKVILSNKAHPEFGQATVPLPIPDSEYDHTIGLLEDMGIGSPTAQDCRVDELISSYPILNRLITQSVNLDELDYLAKRLDSFCQGENEKFQAMACKLGLSDIKTVRALQRLDVKDASQCTAVLDTDNICDAVRKVFEEEFKPNEHLDALNHLARCYQGFKGDDLEKFHTVFDHAWPQTPEEATYLAEGLRDFNVINGISTAEEYGQIIADRMEVSPELSEFLDLQRLGQRQIDEEGGEFGDRGYVAYKGTRPEIKEILGRHIPPTQEPKMC